MKDLSNYRKSYEKSELLEDLVSSNPIELFEEWFSDAEKLETGEANAMTIATIGKDGFPKSRVVLLKKITKEGFVFYTNYNSEKGLAIAENPNVCLNFFWQNSERQVIVKGTANKVANEDSEEYFFSRPIGSQLGAIVSPQSEVIPSREYLEDNLKKIESATNTIKRPDHWGGYFVTPVVIEFWQGRANRLHDRLRFTYSDNNWIVERLAP